MHLILVTGRSVLGGELSQWEELGDNIVVRRSLKRHHKRLFSSSSSPGKMLQIASQSVFFPLSSILYRKVNRALPGKSRSKSAIITAVDQNTFTRVIIIITFCSLGYHKIETIIPPRLLNRLLFFGSPELIMENIPLLCWRVPKDST